MLPEMKNEDFSKYQQMYENGTTLEELYLAGKADSFDFMKSLRMLRITADCR